MNMPGFTAETAIYSSGRQYVGRSAFGAAQSDGVTPQLPPGFCMADCDQQYDWGSIDNAVCKFDCMGGDGGGGGGGGDSGPSDCALCLRSCARKPAARRKACRQDCREDFCT